MNAAYRRGGARAWTSEAELVGGPRITEDGFRELLAPPGSVVLVAERGGRLLGCVHLELGQGGACLLGLLSVDPEEQAAGIGRELLAAAEAHARDRMGAALMAMNVVSVRPELLAWYERRGYVRTGRLVPFEPHPGVTFLRGPLAFERLEKRLPP